MSGSSAVRSALLQRLSGRSHSHSITGRGVTAKEDDGEDDAKPATVTFSPIQLCVGERTRPLKKRAHKR